MHLLNDKNPVFDFIVAEQLVALWILEEIPELCEMPDFVIRFCVGHCAGYCAHP